MSDSAAALLGGEPGAPEPGAGEGQDTAVGGGGGQDTVSGIDWLQGAQPEDIDYVKNKGWQSPADVLNGYRNVEKMVGGKINIPEEGDEAGWNNLFGKLGRPEDPNGYEFGELPEGHDESDVEWFRPVAHKYGLSAKQAAGLAKEFSEYQQGRVGEFQEKTELEHKQELATLQSEWGKAFDMNVNIGKTGIAALGLNQQQVAAIESVLGTAGTFKMAHQVGVKIGEAKFEDGEGGSGGFNTMSPQQAQAEYRTLMDNDKFKERYLAGEQTALDRVTQLQSIIAGN